MKQEVAIDRDGPVLSFHDPEKMASLHGMEVVTEATARAEGAVQCSRCWPNEQDGVLYDFPYTDDGVITV